MSLEAVNGQGVTGQMSGTVTYTSGAVVPRAAVTLIYELTKQAQTFMTDSNGFFVFPGLVPASYTIQVTHSDFHHYEQTGIIVGAHEFVDLHD
jgi:hypothetical protein